MYKDGRSHRKLVSWRTKYILNLSLQSLPRPLEDLEHNNNIKLIYFAVSISMQVVDQCFSTFSFKFLPNLNA